MVEIETPETFLQTLTPFPIYEGLGRILWEANRAICIALGDESQPPWENAPAWATQSMTNGIRWALDLLENGHDLTAYDAHTHWLSFKKKAGWSYGPVKDSEAKTHPDMVEWEDLPPWEQFKDFVFVGIITAFHESARNENIRQHST